MDAKAPHHDEVGHLAHDTGGVQDQLASLDENARALASAIEAMRDYILSIERALVDSGIDMPARVALDTRDTSPTDHGAAVMHSRIATHLEYRPVGDAWRIVLVEEQESRAKDTTSGEGRWLALGATIRPVRELPPESLLLAAPHAAKLLAAISTRQDELKEQVEAALWSSVVDAIAIGRTDLVEHLREAEQRLRNYRRRSE